ncbi:MAG: hypothetical protein Q8J64_00715 [Thermodesulfovibrionales bacterium]|nr:hypothetical protein [Thermodesulfovibrionales bacterium]
MLGLKKIGGTEVGKGNYWNFSTGERVHMDAAGILPGNGEVVYYKLPPVVMLAAAPVLGLVYAVFLPFIGIAMLVTVVAGKLFGGVFAGMWKGATFSWKPSEAYLAGKKKKKEEKNK